MAPVEGHEKMALDLGSRALSHKEKLCEFPVIPACEPFGYVRHDGCCSIAYLLAESPVRPKRPRVRNCVDCPSKPPRRLPDREVIELRMGHGQAIFDRLLP